MTKQQLSHGFRHLVNVVALSMFFSCLMAAQQIGVLTPLYSSFGPQGTSTFITPYVASQSLTITKWKANFPGGTINGLAAPPSGVQLKVFRPISPTQLQVVNVGLLHDPSSTLLAMPGYPFIATDTGIVEFTESNLALVPGDIIGLTITPDPGVGFYYYTLVRGADSRIVLHEVGLGGTVDLNDPYTGVLPGDVPAMLINTALNVVIDIKPGSYPNAINLSSSGVVPVAILSSVQFDALTVNPDTISLAGARVKLVGKSNTQLCHAEDVNQDSVLDLVCQVNTAQFIIEPGDSLAVLEAETYDGRDIRGEDSIKIVPDN